MLIISPSDCIRCYFDSKSITVTGSYSEELKVFYAETKDLISGYTDLKNYITENERLRAARFLIDEDRETYILSHSLLRLILAKELNMNPMELSVTAGKNNKPCLAGNPLFFNLSHTREAFAFVVSRASYVGIDLEMVNTGMDFSSIIRNFFSKKEIDCILRSESEAIERFFLLWTRKEALLKALGTGIINDLTKIEVSEDENFIYRKSFENAVIEPAFKEHFVYSKKLQNNYLSIATPLMAEISINYLNSENIVSYLDKKNTL